MNIFAVLFLVNKLSAIIVLYTLTLQMICSFCYLFTTQEDTIEGGYCHKHCRHSKINLVDLAGSERLSHTCSSGDRLRVSNF
jgi:Kinesin motor domain.